MSKLTSFTLDLIALTGAVLIFGAAGFVAWFIWLLLRSQP